MKPNGFATSGCVGLQSGHFNVNLIPSQNKRNAYCNTQPHTERRRRIGKVRTCAGHTGGVFDGPVEALVAVADGGGLVVAGAVQRTLGAFAVACVGLEGAGLAGCRGGRSPGAFRPAGSSVSTRTTGSTGWQMQHCCSSIIFALVVPALSYRTGSFISSLSTFYQDTLYFLNFRTCLHLHASPRQHLPIVQRSLAIKIQWSNYVCDKWTTFNISSQNNDTAAVFQPKSLLVVFTWILPFYRPLLSSFSTLCCFCLFCSFWSNPFWLEAFISAQKHWNIDVMI